MQKKYAHVKFRLGTEYSKVNIMISTKSESEKKIERYALMLLFVGFTKFSFPERLYFSRIQCWYLSSQLHFSIFH